MDTPFTETTTFNRIKKLGSMAFHGLNKLIAPKVGEPMYVPVQKTPSVDTSVLSNPGLTVQKPLESPGQKIANLATSLVKRSNPIMPTQKVQAELPQVPKSVEPTPTESKTRIISNSGWHTVPPSNVPKTFDYEPFRKSGTYTPPQPPEEYAKLIHDEFPNEASRAALIAATESGFNPNGYNFNSGASGMYKNSGDYGLFQINNVTLEDFMRRFPGEVKAIGIKSVEDLKDPKKNVKMAKLIAQNQGWGSWYGPKNRGFDVTK